MSIYFFKPRAFICYRIEDEPLVNQFRGFLNDKLYKKNVIYDKAKIKGGEGWEDKAKHLISKCQFFFIVIGGSFVSRVAELDKIDDPVWIEIKAAKKLNKLIIPVFIVSKNPGLPGLLKNKLTDEVDLPSDVKKILLEIISKNSPPIYENDWDVSFERWWNKIKYLLPKSIWRKIRRPFFYILFFSFLFALIWKSLDCFINWVYGPKLESVTTSDSTAVYNAIKVGEKLFLAENLNCQFPTSFCLDSIGSKCGKYGRYYSWNAARIVCASCLGSGWHLLTKDDWNYLINSYPESGDSSGRELFFTLTEGELGFMDFLKGFEKSGFNALPSGIFEKRNKTFSGDLVFGYYWVDSLIGSNAAFIQFHWADKSFYDSGIIDTSKFFLNVRCVKNCSVDSKN